MWAGKKVAEMGMCCRSDVLSFAVVRIFCSG